jgi:hypothetical protein
VSSRGGHDLDIRGLFFEGDVNVKSEPHRSGITITNSRSCVSYFPPQPTASAAMTPTPPSHSSFADSFRFRSRRQRHADPYDPSHNATPSQTQALPRVNPLPDDGEEEELSEMNGDDEEDDEILDADAEAEMDEEGNDAEEEEGGIEEGLFRLFFLLHTICCTLFCFLPTRPDRCLHRVLSIVSKTATRAVGGAGTLLGLFLTLGLRTELNGSHE